MKNFPDLKALVRGCNKGCGYLVLADYLEEKGFYRIAIEIKGMVAGPDRIADLGDGDWDGGNIFDGNDSWVTEGDGDGNGGGCVREFHCGFNSDPVIFNLTIGNGLGDGNNYGHGNWYLPITGGSGSGDGSWYGFNKNGIW